MILNFRACPNNAINFNRNNMQRITDVTKIYGYEFQISPLVTMFFFHCDFDNNENDNSLNKISFI